MRLRYALRGKKHTMGRVLDQYTVLIAEDERAVRMLLRVVLEGAGATVLEAENGRQALRLLELEPGRFDLVITDLNMPVMDGEQLVVAIRSQFGKSLPIIMCSAMDVLGRAPMLQHLMSGIVNKPFSPPELVRAAALALAQRRDLDERRAAV